MAVAVLAALLGVVEVRPELLRVGLAEAERAQPAETLVSVHGTSWREGREPAAPAASSTGGTRGARAGTRGR